MSAVPSQINLAHDCLNARQVENHIYIESPVCKICWHLVVMQCIARKKTSLYANYLSTLPLIKRINKIHFMDKLAASLQVDLLAFDLFMQMYLYKVNVFLYSTTGSKECFTLGL